MQQYTLLQINELVQFCLTPLSSQDYWVLAEVAEVKPSGRGHVYLELVEKSDDEIVARLSAAVWFSQMSRIAAQYGAATYQILKKGNKVLLRGSVSFHPVYGLKMNIVDLDPATTLGDLALRRRQTIERLQNEGLTRQNYNNNPLPLVVQRLAIISSATAAGYGDFINHIRQNPAGYKVATTLYQSAMQGDEVERELLAQLKSIARNCEQYDAALIIRGGGSSLDLEAFNSYTLAAAIAQMPLPILTGIGHQQDETVVDLVAHTAFKTPTAVAEFVLNSFAEFDFRLYHAAEQLSRHSQTQLHAAEVQLHTAHNTLQLGIQQRLTTATYQLARCEDHLPNTLKQRLQNAQQQLAHYAQLCQLLQPERMLRRGFAIVRHENTNRIIAQAAQLQTNDRVVVQLSDGSVPMIVSS